MKSDTPSTSKRGGARKGAGRKVGSGQFKEPTVVKRIPESLVISLEQWLAEHKNQKNPHSEQTQTSIPADAMMMSPDPVRLRVPLAQDAVRAGLPASASPDISDYLDFNTYLVNNPAETIAVYVKGDSMAKVGIFEGDMLVVDRSVEAHHRDIVLANLDDEFTVKRLIKTTSGVELHPENDDYPIIRPNAESVLSIVGVVLYSIKKTW
jgi:DNA polymerase V